MDFVAVVDQAIALLRQRGHLTYSTLKRQFQRIFTWATFLYLVVNKRVKCDFSGGS